MGSATTVCCPLRGLKLSSLALPLLFLIASAPSAAAQELTGLVFDGESSAPIGEARVVVLSSQLAELASRKPTDPDASASLFLSPIRCSSS